MTSVWVIVSSATISVVATLVFIWADIRTLERRYLEKDRLLDDQLKAVARALALMADTQRDTERLVGGVQAALKVIKPFADNLEKTY